MPIQQKPDCRQIKGVLLDVDGTLYHQTPLRIMMALYLIFWNLHQPKELYRKIKIIKCYRNSLEILRNCTETSNSPRCTQVQSTAEQTGEDPSLVSEIVAEWLEQRPLPLVYLCRRRNLTKALSELISLGFRLGVYSDYPVDRKLEVLRISSFICANVCSDDPEVLGLKPNSKGFEVAAQKMDLHPSEILYVGDRPDVDGLGALRAGMQVIIIRNFFKKSRHSDYPSCFSISGVIRTLIQ